MGICRQCMGTGHDHSIVTGRDNDDDCPFCYGSGVEDNGTGYVTTINMEAENESNNNKIPR